MIQSIEQYLSLLKKEFSGCDRATIQDALSDTEGHLSMAFNSTMADGQHSRIRCPGTSHRKIRYAGRSRQSLS